MQAPLKLCIDGRVVAPRRTGVGYYTEAIVRGLDRNAADVDQVTVLTNDPDSWNSDPLHQVILRRVAVSHEAHPANEWFLNRTLKQLAAETPMDVFWGPAFVIPLVHVPFKRVVTIHDLTVSTCPEHYPMKFRIYMKQVIKRSVKVADLIFTDTESVRSDLVARFPVAEPKVHVVPAAADALFSPGTRHRKEKPYVLTIGHGDPRKQTDQIIAAFQAARRRYQFPHRLYVVGAGQTQAHLEDLQYLDYQARDQLATLYREADLFLFASQQEGFGLPPLEAMASGCPVLASRSRAVEEVCGDAVRYCSFENVEAAGAEMGSMLTSNDQCTDLRTRGLARSREFSWDKSARMALEHIRKLVTV